MQYRDLNDFMKTGKAVLAKGPIAMILVEDLVEVESTIRHHMNAGFTEILVFTPPELTLPRDLLEDTHIIPWNMFEEGATEKAVNAIIGAAPDQWLYYCYNAEYLFHPFCETRNVNEMLAFHTEERRDAMLTYVVDLYAGDLQSFPTAVSVKDAYFDKTGYYALARQDPENPDHAKTRQLDFFGGLRWRFEEHIPKTRRRIDRISLFRAKDGLRLLQGHVFNDEEYNTYSCEWHHNLTAAICSFRTAKALRANPGSKFEVQGFTWHNTEKFNWDSRQLMDLGLMEPGQWF